MYDWMLMPKARGVYFFVLCFFVSVKFVGESDDKATCHVIKLHVEFLSFVINTTVGCRAVEKVVPLKF